MIINHERIVRGGYDRDRIYNWTLRAETSDFWMAVRRTSRLSSEDQREPARSVPRKHSPETHVVLLMVVARAGRPRDKGRLLKVNYAGSGFLAHNSEIYMPWLLCEHLEKVASANITVHLRNGRETVDGRGRGPGNVAF